MISSASLSDITVHTMHQMLVEIKAFSLTLLLRSVYCLRETIPKTCSTRHTSKACKSQQLWWAGSRSFQIKKDTIQKLYFIISWSEIQGVHYKHGRNQNINAISTSGLYPSVDKWMIDLAWQYDEVIDSTVATTTRWYQIQTQQTLFVVTESPVDANTFIVQDPASVSDSAFDAAIADGADSLVNAILVP